MITKKIFIRFFFLFAASFSYAQTGVVVTYYNSTTQGFNVATTGKLYFADDNLNIKTDGTTTPTTIPVSIIRKITFTQALANTTFGENKNHLTIYPNPSNGIIQIGSNNFDLLNVEIYSLSGQLLEKGTYTPNESIDISKLSVGMYLIQVNDVTLKFCKK